MAAVVTDPASPLTLAGSATTVAPLAAASVAVLAASSTRQARWRIPSPCRSTCRDTSLSGPRPAVITNRTSPWARTYDTRSCDAGLGAGVGDHLEAEARGEPGGHGPGVADPPFQVVPTEQPGGHRRGGVGERRRVRHAPEIPATRR